MPVRFDDPTIRERAVANKVRRADFRVCQPTGATGDEFALVFWELGECVIPEGIKRFAR